MHIQLSHRKESEVGRGDFWILTCDLFEKTRPDEDVPVVHLCIKHQAGGGAYEKVFLRFDEHSGEARIIVTEHQFEEMQFEIQSHEGIGDAEAHDRLAGKYATDEYCRTVWGWNPLKKAEEMRKRWEAIKLLVDPHIDL